MLSKSICGTQEFALKAQTTLRIPKSEEKNQKSLCLPHVPQLTRSCSHLACTEGKHSLAEEITTLKSLIPAAVPSPGSGF